jgi:hypothetical protein
MGRVTALLRRTAAARTMLAALGVGGLIALTAAGCGATTEQSPSPTRLASPTASGAAPSLTAVPGGPASPIASPSGGRPTTTETEFGTIFDALPQSFPKLPGQEPADTGEGPTSGSFVVTMGVDAASAAIISGLKAQGWTVESISTLEDGSTVIALTGPVARCAAEVRFVPVSGTLMMSVLYGASCPFS